MEARSPNQKFTGREGAAEGGTMGYPGRFPRLPPDWHRHRKGPAARFLRCILTCDRPTRRFGIDKLVQCIILGTNCQRRAGPRVQGDNSMAPLVRTSWKLASFSRPDATRSRSRRFVRRIFLVDQVELVIPTLEEVG